MCCQFFARFTAILGLFSILEARGGEFYTDFNSGTPAGSYAYGNAVVNPVGGTDGHGVLRLTPAERDRFGTFIIKELDQEPVRAFSASFKVCIQNGYRNGADGFSFNFGRALPDRITEDGARKGLNVLFDTYTDNGRGPHTVTVCFHNKNIASFTPGNLRTGSRFVDVEITFDRNDMLTVSYDGKEVVKDLVIPDYKPIVGQFGFGARTGDIVDNHLIDDLTIITETARSPKLARVMKKNLKPSARVMPEPFLVLNGGETFKGTLFKPEGQGPFPALVFCQNEAGADVSGEVTTLGQRCADQGYILLVPGRHRFSDRSSDPERQLVDEQEFHARNLGLAIEVLKARADVNENRVSLLGEGAGANTVLLGASKSAGARALVLLSPDPSPWSNRTFRTRVEQEATASSAALMVIQPFDAVGADVTALTRIIEQKGPGNRLTRVPPGVEVAAFGAAESETFWSEQVFPFLNEAMK